MSRLKLQFGRKRFRGGTLPGFRHSSGLSKNLFRGNTNVFPATLGAPRGAVATATTIAIAIVY